MIVNVGDFVSGLMRQTKKFSNVPLPYRPSNLVVVGARSSCAGGMGWLVCGRGYQLFWSGRDDLLTRLRHHDFSILVGCFKLAAHIASIRS